MRRRTEREREAQLFLERAARLQAEEFNRFRDDVISTTAHDLGNPLTVIKTTAQMLRRQITRSSSTVSPSGLASLDRIGRAVDQLQRALGQLSDLAYLQVGSSPVLVRGTTDLVAMARRLVEQQQLTNESYSVDLQAAVPTLTGWWDHDRLERAITNLLSNAIEYSPSGGRILVEVREEEVEAKPWAILSVRDWGVGIPPSDLAWVFEKRRRGSNVTSSIPGQGVGLTSARQVVILHGGTISVDSEEGRGSIFTIRLPVLMPNDQIGIVD